MKLKYGFWRAALGLFLLPLVARGGEADRLRVVVSILPQAYFAERIGGERVAVEVLVRPGQSAEMYQPTPRQMAALGRAALYLRIGMPLESVWTGRIREANPGIKIVDVSEGLARRTMQAHAHEGEAQHDHEKEQTGNMAVKDPHVWLDPVLGKRIAANTARALAEADPAGKEIYGANLARLQADLDLADREIRAMLAGVKMRKFLIYHPALGYFAARYDLQQIPIEIEGKNPTARNLDEMINQARAGGIRVVFVQKQFSARGAETVALAIGGRVEPLDDLAKDYLNNLRAIARAIAQAGGEARDGEKK